MKHLFWIGLGSGLGGGARYGLGLVSGSLGLDSAWAITLLVNLSGSFLIGWLAGRWSGASSKEFQRHFWMTGFCAGFTTFSVFAWQVGELVGQEGGQAAGLYAAGSIGFGLLAVWSGLSVASKTRGTT